jgi:hypothetical protein
MASRLPLGVSRVYHRAIDGTIPYFRSEGGMQEEGRLPEGSDPAELLSQGYVEANRDDFVEARTRLDPLRPVPGSELPTIRPSVANPTPPMSDPEDAALDEFAAAVEASGIGRPTPRAMPAPRAATPTTRPAMRPPAPRAPPIPRGNTEADVDALGAEFEEFYNRANPVEVQRVPSTVPLASRMGGAPLPFPGQGGTSVPPTREPQRGPVLGDTDTLDDAQRRAGLLRGLGGMGKGMSRVGAAIAGVRPEEGAAGDMAQGADSQVRDYLMRKQQAEADKATAKQAALADPTSPESQRFQALVGRAFGSVYTPEQISAMTAADAPMVGKYGEMVRTLEDRAAGRAAAQQSEQTQLAARSSEAEKQRAFEATEGAKQRALQREIAGMRQGAAGDKAEEAHQRRMSERNVGGFDIDPANPPTAEGAKNMARAVDARAQIKGSLDRLETLFNEYGTEMGGGTAQSGMEAELGNITTQLRLFNQMGVPNLNDYTELAKQIPQTAGVGAWFSRDGSIREKFKTLRDQLDRAVSSTANAYKFKPTGGATHGAQAPVAGSAPRRKVDAKGQTWEEGPDGEMRMVL